MNHTVPFDPSLLDTHLLVDVRTPLEFAEDHLPGAINVPILTDAERVQVGTVYKQQGARQARQLGLRLSCHRFPDIVDYITAAAAGKPVLTYCWRGGLRSESVTVLMDMAGYQVSRLAGGYKRFRKVVTDFFAAVALPVQLLVLHGMTGSGKTEFLLQLPAEQYTVIDLEGLAHHRGSAFGSLGLLEQPGQKRFETLLWNAFRLAPPDRPILLEGESKRIGKLTLPGNLYEVMAEGIKIWCDVSQKTRVKRLAAEYAMEEYRAPMEGALLRIREKLGGDQYEKLKKMLDAWDVESLAHGLIEQYYDKLYYKVRKWEPQAIINLEDYQAAERELSKICFEQTTS